MQSKWKKVGNQLKRINNKMCVNRLKYKWKWYEKSSIRVDNILFYLQFRMNGGGGRGPNSCISIAVWHLHLQLMGRAQGLCWETLKRLMLRAKCTFTKWAWTESYSWDRVCVCLFCFVLFIFCLWLLKVSVTTISLVFELKLK